jgi:hypothetical protein
MLMYQEGKHDLGGRRDNRGKCGALPLTALARSSPKGEGARVQLGRNAKQQGEIITEVERLVRAISNN